MNSQRLNIITFWFDPSDPKSATAFKALPERWQGQSVVVDYMPVSAWAMMRDQAPEPDKAPWLFCLLAAATHLPQGLPNRQLTRSILHYHSLHQSDANLTGPSLQAWLSGQNITLDQLWEPPLMALAQRLQQKALAIGVQDLPSETPLANPDIGRQ